MGHLFYLVCRSLQNSLRFQNNFIGRLVAKGQGKIKDTEQKNITDVIPTATLYPHLPEFSQDTNSLSKPSFYFEETIKLLKQNHLRLQVILFMYILLLGQRLNKGHS